MKLNLKREIRKSLAYVVRGQKWIYTLERKQPAYVIRRGTSQRSKLGQMCKSGMPNL